MTSENEANPARQSPYMFSAGKGAQEWQRLDKQHEGILRYLEGRLSFAPIESPKKILELGAGTGSWAIQAANEYPKATIVAVDMSPLPSRSLPVNMNFQQLDLLGELPWEDGTFDVVHMRLLLYHMPEPANFIRRVIPLLKPGGWLLIEDCCVMRYASASGPAQKKRDEIMTTYMVSKGQDTQIGAHIEHLLQDTGSLSRVFSKKVVLPLTPLPDDPSIRPFAETMKESIIRATTGSWSSDLVKAGMTTELQRAWQEEMNDLRYDPVHDFYFFWACR